MPEFKITWIIELNAVSFLGAALKALDIQRDPDSAATFFGVVDTATGQSRLIDAGEVDQ